MQNGDGGKTSAALPVGINPNTGDVSIELWARRTGAGLAASRSTFFAMGDPAQFAAAGKYLSVGVRENVPDTSTASGHIPARAADANKVFFSFAGTNENTVDELLTQNTVVPTNDLMWHHYGQRKTPVREQQLQRAWTGAREFGKALAPILMVCVVACSVGPCVPLLCALRLAVFTTNAPATLHLRQIFFDGLLVASDTSATALSMATNKINTLGYGAKSTAGPDNVRSDEQRMGHAGARAVSALAVAHAAASFVHPPCVCCVC